MNKILLLTHEFLRSSGDVARYCWNVAAAAARVGNEVTLFAPEYRDRGAHTHLDPPGVRVIRFPGDVFKFRSLWRLEREVKEVVASDTWEVVHAADWPMTLALRNVERASGMRVASLHGSDPVLLGRSLRAFLSGAADALSRFDRYACSSAYTASMLVREFRLLSSADVRIVPPGIDPWWFGQPSGWELQEFYRRIDYWAGDRIVLTVADLEPHAGHLPTLGALRALPEPQRAGVKYVCVGKTVNTDYLQRLVTTAAESGVRIVLPGQLPDSQLRAAYKAADVLALCGYGKSRKGAGVDVTVIEAAAQGLPAIVNRVQQLAEVVRDRDTGWICHESNSEELARTFAEALAGANTRPMRAACTANAFRFSWERCAGATYTVGRSRLFDEAGRWLPEDHRAAGSASQSSSDAYHALDVV